MEVCMKCSRELTRDEIALYRRLVNRGAERYLCIDCLAEHLRVSVPLLEERMKFLKEMGCTLFK